MDKDKVNLERQKFQLFKMGIDSIVKWLEKIASKDTSKIKLEGVSLVTIKGDKGDDGHTPTDQELLSIIKPLIPKLRQPEDGHTPTTDEILAIIKPLIPNVKDGETPSDERLVSLIKPLIPEIKTDEASIVQKTVKILEPMIPKEETAKALSVKLGTVKEKWLPIEAIKGDFPFKNGVPVIQSLRHLNDVDYSNVPMDSKGNFILGAGGSKTYAGLSDVNMTGLADGNMPIWDETTGKWLPGTPTDTDEKVKLSASDPTAGYLDAKLVESNKVLLLDQTTPQSIINGAPLFNVGLKSPKIYPSADSTTAVGIFKADGTTNVLNVDTTNGRVGIGKTTSAYKLDVGGTVAADAINTDVGLNFRQVAKPAGASLALVAGGSNLGIGKYVYNVTYTTALGETVADSESLFTTTDAANRKVTVTIPIPTDPRVTGRKIYRSAVNNPSYTGGLLITINDITTTTYLDDKTDASLGGNRYFASDSTNNFITVNGVKVMVFDPNLTLLGSGAGTGITTGGRSTIIGAGAGASVTTGSDNTCIGHLARLSTGGGQQTIIGTYAGYGMTAGASANTMIGGFTGFASSSGSSNVFIGASTGCYSGSARAVNYNTVIGTNAGQALTGDGSVFLGYQSGYYETGSNKLFIDNTKRTNEADARVKALIYGVFAADPANQILTFNAKVGIGTTAPTAYLHLKAGTATASTAPLKFTSGTLNTTAEAGAVEYLTDNLHFTIATGTARKGIVLDDGTRLTSGKIPVATTNGRLIDLTAQTELTDEDATATDGTDATQDQLINNMRTRINELETKLVALGLLVDAD